MKASSLPSSSKRLREKQEQERLCLRAGHIATRPPSDAYREGYDGIDFSNAPWRKGKGLQVSEPGPVRLAVRTPDEQRQASLVARLEELLEDARRGEVESVMVVADYRDSSSADYWVSGSPDLERTIGRLEVLLHGQVRRFLGLMSGE